MPTVMGKALAKAALIAARLMVTEPKFRLGCRVGQVLCRSGRLTRSIARERLFLAALRKRGR